MGCVSIGWAETRATNFCIRRESVSLRPCHRAAKMCAVRRLHSPQNIHFLRANMALRAGDRLRLENDPFVLKLLDSHQDAGSRRGSGVRNCILSCSASQIVDLSPRRHPLLRPCDKGAPAARASSVTRSRSTGRTQSKPLSWPSRVARCTVSTFDQVLTSGRYLLKEHGIFEQSCSSCQRRIPLNSICGMSKSSCSMELVVHVENGHDYHLETVSSSAPLTQFCSPITISSALWYLRRAPTSTPAAWRAWICT